MTRKLPILLAALATASCLTAFLIWAERRPSDHYLSDLRSVISSEAAPPHRRGNLLLIRPQLYPLDYRSPDHLRLKLRAALDHAQQADLLTPDTLVALPEHIGTWLLARGEKVEFYQARNRQEVRDWLLLGNPLLAIKALLLNLDADRLDEALLRMKATQMAEDYQQLFGGLAREYRVTLLAGSILLPEPSIRNGQLRSGSGALRNLSLVFSPQGEIQGQGYDEPWPWRADSGAAQLVEAGSLQYRVVRDWRAGYPQSSLQPVDGGQPSPPLFLRGKLGWPIGGAPRDVRLTPEDVEQASSAPGSHLLNLWITPE
ncbi:hydrolase [Pseudomonas zhanjiangensis]|uniref:Hydrolase n=1 Tax=Pseudomonas zhanjiangensis TaxID=3239015 RepID=A0ABV3YRZ5_9PSED